MLFFFLLTASAFAGMWLLRFFRGNFYRLAENTLATLDVMLSSADDDEKLELMQRYTGKMVVYLLLVVLLLAVAVLIIISPYHIPDLSSLPAWAEVLAISLGASLPFFVPLPKSASGYSEPAKLLHRLVLNNYALQLKLFKRELKKVQGKAKDERFIIVSGLARAGTTSLMNVLAENQQLKSLHYGQMPFLLSPNTWSRIYKPKGKKELERSHKDGIKISLRSNEALEEHFFKAITGDRFIGDETITQHQVSSEEYAHYLNYQKLVAKDTSSIYLAKNNNFILRYRAFRKFNDKFCFIILFRHPLYHAASLLEKHKQYIQLQSEDPFVLEYMDWLGHHEFGQNHKWFSLDGSQPPQESKDSLDYWLQVWINYYQYAQNIEHTNSIFIDYQDFCERPKQTLEVVQQRFPELSSQATVSSFSNPRKVELAHDQKLLQTALKIYENLQAKVRSGR